MAALVAASAALDQHGLVIDFDQWAIVSSTRYLAREAFAAVIDKYQVDGPWGVSVQAIPHGTPHAAASTLSMALGVHGPCIGVGVAAGDESQALLSAAGLLQNPRWIGAWLLFSAWSSRPSLQFGSDATADSTCIAAALAVINPELHLPAKVPVLGHIEFRVGQDATYPSSTEHEARVASALTEFFVGWGQAADPWRGHAGAELQIAIGRDDSCIAGHVGQSEHSHDDLSRQVRAA